MPQTKRRRVSGSAVTTKQSLKKMAPADQLVSACHQLAAVTAQASATVNQVVGADTGRETVMTGCHRRTARHWNAIASGEDWKSRENGTDTDQQSIGQRCSRNRHSRDMPAPASQEAENLSRVTGG